VQDARAKLQAAEDALKIVKERYQAKCKEVERLQSDKNLINKHAESVESENRCLHWCLWELRDGVDTLV
jgi:outer membrane protein TolC